MTLTEFLLTRIAEDEREAKSAVSTTGAWEAYEVNDEPAQDQPTGAQLCEVLGKGAYAVLLSHDRHLLAIGTTNEADLSDIDSWISVPDGGTHMEYLSHIARWDPARVLAECEAKRRIVEQASIYADAQYPDYEGGYQSAMEDVLALLALPYADHPDYDEAWRP